MPSARATQPRPFGLGSICHRAAMRCRAGLGPRPRVLLAIPLRLLPVAAAALLTVRVFTFYRDPNTYVPSSLQPGLYTSDEYMIGGNIIEAELVFTDKETGKVIYTHVMRKRPISTVFGGDGVKHILKVIKAKK